MPPVVFWWPRVSPRGFKTRVRIADFVSICLMLVSWGNFACGPPFPLMHYMVPLTLLGSSALLQVAFPPQARALMQSPNALLRLSHKPLALHEFFLVIPPEAASIYFTPFIIRLN